MKTVYCVSIEDDSSGRVDWYHERADAESNYEAAIKDPSWADQEINLFALDVDGPEDEITYTVDAAMWDRSYTPIRWRAGSAHSAAAHETPPTDAPLAQET